jgi:hypothetical protein
VGSQQTNDQFILNPETILAYYISYLTKVITQQMKSMLKNCKTKEIEAFEL